MSVRSLAVAIVAAVLAGPARNAFGFSNACSN